MSIKGVVRVRIVWVVALFVVSTVLTVVSAPTAVAAAATIYVDNYGTCADDGEGTEALPFCTVQAAADSAEPGQTVDIFGEYHETVTLTRSGTEDAPIVFTGGRIVQSSGSTPPVTLRGVHDILLRSVDMRGAPGAESLLVDNSHRITIDRARIWPQRIDKPQPGGMRITGESSGITVSRTYLDTVGRAVHVDGGSDITLTGNRVYGHYNLGLLAESVDRLAVTGNTIEHSCTRGILVTGATTDSSIQNNVVAGLKHPEYGTCSDEPVRAIEVAATAAPDVTLDYNLVYSLLRFHYRWAGVDYQTPAELYAATGQAAHDLNENPYDGTAVVDSANADAPGALELADRNEPRVDNPAVPNTGAGVVPYYDRGAVEAQDSFTRHTLSISASQAPVGGDVVVTGELASKWNVEFTCAVDFGDGTTTSVSPCTATHAYTAPGTYSVRVTATNASQLSISRTWTVVVVPAGGELTPTITATTLGAMTARFSVAPGDTPWNVTSTTFELGDRTETVEGTRLEYTFRRPGTFPVRATVRDAGGRTATVGLTYSTVASGYVRFGPARLLDTRDGTGAARRKIAPHSTVRVTLGGRAGIPSGVTAVGMNVTVVNAASAGYVTAHAAGTARPNTSSVDFRAGRITPGFAIVAVGRGGAVDLYNGSGVSIDLVADVTGYFTKAGWTEGFTAVEPRRLLDTRSGMGSEIGAWPITAGGTVGLHVSAASSGNIPLSTRSVLLNVTVVDPRTSGHLTAYPAGSARPTTSNLNFVAGQTVSNTVIAPLGPDLRVLFYASATTHIVVDAVGYFGGGSYLVPTVPTREVDTRNGIGGVSGALAPRSVTVHELGDDITPVRDGRVIVYNAKVLNAQRRGYLTAYPDSRWRPDTAILDFEPRTVVANLTATQGSRTAFYNGSAGTIDLVVDRTGYFAAY